MPGSPRDERGSQASGIAAGGLAGVFGGDPHDLALSAEALTLLRAADDGVGAPEAFVLPTCGERLIADATPSSSRALAKLALDASRVEIDGRILVRIDDQRGGATPGSAGSVAVAELGG